MMDIKEYLVETKYCDFSNPLIQELAIDFQNKYTSKVELATAIFYFVRDNISYTVGNWNKKASYTLKHKHGTCTNNSNLMVALCRACGIPSGYGVMDVVGPEYFGQIVPPRLSKTVSKKSKHVYCYVYQNDNWIKCDPSDDEPLSINTQHLNPQSTVVEWNGISDSVLNLHPSHIIHDAGPLASIDYLMDKTQRKIMSVPIKIGNLYIDFLRENGRNIKTVEELEIKFETWMKKRHFLHYVLLEFFFLFYDIINKNKIGKNNNA